jgi:Protein of unknown function (DUF4235)
MSKSETIALKIYTAVAATIAAQIAAKVVTRVWAKTTGKAPPTQPNSPEVHWAEAIGWSVVSGTAIGVARLVASRRAAGAWQRVSR